MLRTCLPWLQQYLREMPSESTRHYLSAYSISASSDHPYISFQKATSNTGATA